MDEGHLRRNAIAAQYSKENHAWGYSLTAYNGGKCPRGSPGEPACQEPESKRVPLGERGPEWGVPHLMFQVRPSFRTRMQKRGEKEKGREKSGGGEKGGGGGEGKRGDGKKKKEEKGRRGEEGEEGGAQVAVSQLTGG